MDLDPTRQRLIEAAGEEFAEKGFDKATIRSICERAGANIAAVNYHFGDKEQLYIQTVLAAHRCMPEEVATALDLPETPLEEQLRLFIHNMLADFLAIQSPDLWQHQLMLREMIRPTAASEILVNERIRPMFERLRGIVRQALPEGDDRKVLAAVFSVIGQCLHYKMGRMISEKLVGAEMFASFDLDFLTDHITRSSLRLLGLGEEVASISATGERS